VTSGGKINAYAAQAFAQFTLQWLAANHRAINAGNIKQQAIDCFAEAVRKEHNPGKVNPEYDAEGGSATGVFVTTEVVTRDTLIVHGAAIGDAVALLVSVPSGTTIQLNSYIRRGGSARDPGGQLCMCMGMDGSVSAFSTSVAPHDLVILASDGLTDNIVPGELCVIVPFLICCTYFDNDTGSYSEPTMGASPHLPTFDELDRITASTKPQDLRDVTAEVAARRLTNYLHWVTRSVHELEQTYYSQKFRLKQLHKCVDDEDVVAEIRRTDALLMQMEASKKAMTAGKTDDCLIVVLHPCTRSFVSK
jgi:hypothetical protein